LTQFKAIYILPVIKLLINLNKGRARKSNLLNFKMPKKKRVYNLEEELDKKLDSPADGSVDDEDGADLLEDDSLDEEKEESSDGDGF